MARRFGEPLARFLFAALFGSILIALLLSMTPGQMDLSRSVATGRAISEIIGEQVPLTFLNLAKGIAWALVPAAVLGVLAGRRHGTLVDRVAQAPAVFLMAPAFVVLITLVALAGRDSVSTFMFSSFPFALAVFPWLTRATRTGVISGQGGGVVLSAVAHSLRQAPNLLVSIVFAELIGNTGGAGRLMFQAMMRRDIGVLAHTMLWLLAASVALTLLGDLAAAADARPIPAAKRLPLGWLIGGGILFGTLFVVALASFGDANKMDIASRLLPPGGEHPLGTDPLGRDLLARLASGARQTLTTALGATVLSVMGGGALGLLGGALGRFGGIVAPRITPVSLLGPLFAALTMAQIFGPGKRLVLMAALALGLLPQIAYAVRRLFVQAPGSGQYLAGTVTLVLAQAVALEVMLGFQGLSMLPPVPTLGNVLRELMPHAIQQPALTLPVYGVVALATGGLYLLGHAWLDVGGEDPEGRTV